MNHYIVKTSGLRWIVKKDGDSTWSASGFSEVSDAIAYAEILAKANRPAVLQILSPLGELSETRNFPECPH